MDSVNDELTGDFHDTIEAIGMIVIGAQSRLNGLESLAKLFNFVVCNPCQSSPSLTILVPLWLIIISYMLFYLYKYYFEVCFNLTVILSMLKITQNTVTEPFNTFHIYYCIKE